MFESITGKVMAGILSLSAMMFTSYTGNDPVFLPMHGKVGQNYLLLKANLDHAFDNDFGDVFKCGKPIHVWFKVEIRSYKQLALTRTYHHTVTYDPMTASWSLFRSESNHTVIYTNYQSLLNNISELDCSLPINEKWKTVEIKTEAWLPEIELTQENRKIDLMVLWKFRKPSIKATMNLESTS
jgi:hypothetical protein